MTNKTTLIEQIKKTEEELAKLRAELEQVEHQGDWFVPKEGDEYFTVTESPIEFYTGAHVASEDFFILKLRTRKAAERYTLACNIIDEYRQKVGHTEIENGKAQWGLNVEDGMSLCLTNGTKMGCVGAVISNDKKHLKSVVDTIGEQRLIWAWRVYLHHDDGTVCPAVGV